MIKIFLVEDEIVIRESIREMIPWNEYGYKFCGEAGDGEMALPMVRNIKPDLIITDIKMPFMDGLTFSKLVKKELPGTRIIIISGYDDFTYAQQAIALGVEQYILKPINRAGLIGVLNKVSEKYEKENAQKVYYDKFQREIQEYEKNSRRDFFESMISGRKNKRNIYEWAGQLEIDVLAQSYNIVLFSINNQSENVVSNDTYSQNAAEILDKIELFFQESQQFILFRNQMFSYAVIVKGNIDTIKDNTTECVEHLRKIFSDSNGEVDWFICIGKSVERLSSLRECYKAAMQAFARRYIDHSHIIHYGDVIIENNELEEININNIDMGAINVDIIHNFLSNALIDEVDSFVRNYIHMIGEEALKSQMFRQFVVLNVHFCTVDFIQKLGYKKENLDDNLAIVSANKSGSIKELSQYMKDILVGGLKLRDENSKSRYRSIINTAIDFIEKNHMDDSLTLNKVACSANLSANHFSALFSQEMEKTFIEYLTNIRMKHAKELLRCSDKRSGVIAMEVGYKDPHYFSFLFKKTQGCTPSEYRKKKASTSIC